MRFIVITGCILLCANVYAQKRASTFNEAIESGISIQKLDDLYPAALSSDSLKSVFVGKEKEFYNGYVSLLQDLSSHLKKNNFNWGKTTRCFNRIYLNKEGQVDYFLFNFKPGELDKVKEEQFKKLLNQFIQTYQFPLQAKSAFAQCSPVSYSD
jgi:hypothetical protein